MNDVLRPTVDSVQRLVRALVSDPHGAADVAQEAWLSALRKGVSGPELGRWVAGAARRIARSSRRDEARRREREQRAGRADEGACPLSAAARLELVRKVVAAVEELDEPFRAAVVMRYFDELPPRAIAARLGVPVNTARSRVRRGIEALRARLGPAALLALLPPARAGSPRGEARPAPLGLRSWSAAGVVSAVVAGVAALAWSRERVATGDARGGELLALAEHAGDAARSSDVPLLAHGGARVAAPRETLPQPLATRAGEAAAAPDSPVADGLAEVRGRLLGEGRALAAAELVLAADILRGDAVRAEADERSAGSWIARATSGDDGRFVLRFDPPAGFGFTLGLELDARTHLAWTILSIAPGERVDLGELVVARATLTGRVLDATGTPITGSAWSVSASGGADAGWDAHASAEVDRSTGAFVLQGLPGGTYELSASSPLAGRIAGPTVELADRELRAADLRYDGPDPAQRIRVDVVVRGFPGLRPAPEHVRLVSDARAPRSAEILAGTMTGFVFDAVAPGAATLVIDDPRFLPWRQAGVVAGTRVEAALAGSAALVLRAFDHATRAPVERFELRFEPAALPGRWFTLHDGARPLERDWLDGIPAGDGTLEIRAEGYGREMVAVAALAPGEVRALDLLLGPGAWLAGRVRHADGSPAAGVMVRCLEPAARDDSADSPFTPLGTHVVGDAAARCRRELSRTLTDEHGAFRFEVARPGAYALAACPGPGRVSASQVVSAVEDRAVEGLELTIP